jgi:hypothetical protein
MNEPKFFSEEWCQFALKAEQAESTRIMKALKKPHTFTHVLAFEVADRPALKCHVKYEAGRTTVWTATDLFDEAEVWARFRADLEHYQEAASGRTPAANLVMAGKMRLVKGTMKDAVENAQSLTLLVRCWGNVPTDWDV